MTMKEDRKKRQRKLANLFFEMGMDLDLIEKISGVDKKNIIQERINQSKDEQLKFNNIYLENKKTF